MQQRSALNKVSAAGLALALMSGVAACNRGQNANNTNANLNSNTNLSANTSANNNPTASQDAALKNTVEANLSKYGVTGITVTTSNGEVTLRGNIARAKLQDAMKAANEASPKRVNNQLNIQ